CGLDRKARSHHSTASERSQHWPAGQSGVPLACRECICNDRAPRDFEFPCRDQLTRETMASRPGAFTVTTSPVASRFLMTVPFGNLSPNFPETNNVPRGVR